MRRALLGLAALFSGIAALVWQVLWIRRMSEAFGHSAYAVNAVLAIFFCGLGVGAWVFGRSADRRKGSIGLYCALEVAIAAAGLAFGPACDAVERAYLSFAPAEWPLSLSILVKGAASVLLLAIPTLAMGGTLTALIRHAAKSAKDLGSLVGWLYGLNTIGAAIGAAGSVLFLLPSFGVVGATLAAMSLNVGAALLAWTARGPARVAAPAPVLARRIRSGRPLRLLAAAAVSGFVVVGFEVLWTRALATRFLNTVYSFATILTVFLLALGLASIVTAALDRRGRVRRSTLALVFGAGGILGLASVRVLTAIPTSFGAPLGGSVAAFLVRELRSSVLVMAVPVLVLGLAFPMIVRLVHAEIDEVGRETGAVYLWNTLGSVAAPLLLGFVALPAVGLRTSLVAISWISVLLALLVAPFETSMQRIRAAAWAGVAVVVALGIGYALPADIRLWRSSPEDKLVDYREGVTCSVAVLDEARGDRVLMLNNDYVLGGLKGAHLPRRQGLIPLLLHPRPESALFIGLGTGGSAGAAAACPDVRVDALEIVPEVIDMLRWFDASNESLADKTAASGSDGRVRILSVDGRHFVRATARRYDVVVGDLFLPYRAGEGAMYTREHIEAVRRVLAPGGIFCQWLPLYQFRAADLRVVVATFCDVFPQVQAFWLHADAVQPVLGLVGSEGPLDLDGSAIGARLLRPETAELVASADLKSPEPMLGGWIASKAALLAWTGDAPVETRDRPRIEYSAPRNTIEFPEDPSSANIATFLEMTASARESGPFARCSNEERERIAAHQRALGHLLRARPGSAEAIEELALALGDAPDWELALGAIKTLGRASVERGDSVTARKAAGVLSKCVGQEHAGLYLSALIARREGAIEEARKLARAALALKPDHRASRELLRELGDAPGSEPSPR